MTGMTLKAMGSRALAELGASIDLIGEAASDLICGETIMIDGGFTSC